MLYLYLDESGDLGFDFVNKKPSAFFVITILAVSGHNNNNLILNAVRKTLKRKLNPPHKRKRIIHELKATNTTTQIKQYFYRLIRDMDMSIYSVILDKKRMFEHLIYNKEKTYNYISRIVLDGIGLEDEKEGISLVVDKSKSKKRITAFDEYIKRQMQGIINPYVPFDIDHISSRYHGGLQAVDLFSWGIFRKYEKFDSLWYDIFKEKIEFEMLYEK